MITIKFQSMFEGGSHKSSSAVVTCARYDVEWYENYACVIVYKDYIESGGVEFHIQADPRCAGSDTPPASHSYYHVAYVENETGKTIDKIGPFNQTIDEVKAA
jgi:hypothetical protein